MTVAAVLALAVRKNFALIAGWTFWILSSLVLALTSRTLPFPFLALIAYLIAGGTDVAVAPWNVILSLIQALTLIGLLIWTVIAVRRKRKE